MAPFAPALDRTQASAIRDYVIERAHDDAARTAGNPRQPDPNHGGVIVAQGTESGAPACAQCHAFTGGSDGSGAFPRVSGQSAGYLSRQLRDFGSGARANPIMSPIAQALSPSRHTRRRRLLCERRNAVPAVGQRPIRRWSQRARNSPRRAIRRREFPAATLVMAPVGWASPRRSRIWPGICAIHRLPVADVAARLPQKQPEAMALIAGKLDDQEIGALAAYYQQARISPSTAQPKP